MLKYYASTTFFKIYVYMHLCMFKSVKETYQSNTLQQFYYIIIYDVYVMYGSVCLTICTFIIIIILKVYREWMQKITVKHCCCDIFSLLLLSSLSNLFYVSYVRYIHIHNVVLSLKGGCFDIVFHYYYLFNRLCIIT